MKFNGKTDIEAPLNTTFAQFADFETFERFGLQSGAEIRRIDDLQSPGPGMMWDVKLDYKAKLRKVTVELVDYDPPNSLTFAAKSASVDAHILIDLLPLSARVTRAAVTIDLAPKSLPARLAVQSARLTKGALTRRFQKRLGNFGAAIEDRIKMA